MRINSLNKIYFFLTILFFSFAVFSCNSSKKIKYFQDIPDSGVLKIIPKVNYSDIIIQPDDILNITVQTIDPLATAVINSANVTSGGSTSASPGGGGAAGILAALSGGNSQQQATNGYVVNKDGFVTMPIIGKIKAAGYTTAHIRDIIDTAANKYYKQPTVVVSLANFKVDITGEVLKPGQYIMPYEKVTIVDALAMAGDLTIFGKRENVLLVRSNLDGSKTPYRINLKKSDIMSKPYYYLRPNDILYIEPRKAKSDATDASQAKYFTIAGAVLSIILVFATRRF